ncbi:hypothetical protein VTJ83DRAFT_6044 [Remersonia thermophila]|uniref:MYND-type domain-containing protein n=1 Tax=Remersonia thermophila TaxID=72144 RepID=A0ABR4D8K6_9PEZI
MAAPSQPGRFRPALSLTEDLPRGLDASILQLGTLDARDILYTAYTEQPASPRKIDITVCDADAHVVARNLLLYTLALDLAGDGKPTPAQLWSLWNICYARHLRRPDFDLLASQSRKLVQLSESLQTWRSSPYGAALRFCTEGSLSVVRGVWSRVSSDGAVADAELAQPGPQAISKQDVAPACAPLAAQMAENVLSAVRQHWDTGKQRSLPLDAPDDAAFPNPLLAASSTGPSKPSYPADPLLSFHLALAQVPTLEKPQAPLREGDGSPKDAVEEFLAVALAHLADWIRAFAEAARSGSFTVRHAVADGLSFCRSLQRDLATAEARAQPHREGPSSGPSEPAGSEHGAGAAAPRRFDIVDASALFEEPTLDLLLAAEPLLKDAPSSTIYTARSYPLTDGDAYEALLHGRTTSLSLLLGLLPAEYWTNARLISPADEILMAWSDKANTDPRRALSGLRLSWKHARYLVGQHFPAPLQANTDGLADLVRHVYLDLAGAPASKTSSAPGTTAALLKALARRAQVDPAELSMRFLSALPQPPSQGDWEIFALEGLAVPPASARSVGLQSDQDTTGPHGAPAGAKTAADESSPELVVATADFDPNHAGDIATVTGRLYIVSDQGKQLLADRAPIEVRQSSPTTLDIIFYGKERALWGKERALVLPMRYPVPVVKDGSKTRIARTSGYIEITAPLAKPSTTPSLLEDHDVLPTVMPAAGSRLPVPLNAPRVHLDRLPILRLDDTSRLGFISTLSSLMFSTRERRLREQTLGNPDGTAPGVSPTTRLNFKESLFTLFMLSAGIQGGQTGLFALSEPRGGSGIHALLFVSAVRLDAASHGGVPVLDAAVLPFTRELLASQELVEFLVLLRTLECCTLTVDEKELALWKRALPALAERCRDWDHLPACEYAAAGSAPVSLRPGEPVLCSCGQGRLPDRFVAVPGWEDAARHATRVAISPVYGSPLVEELVAPELARGVAEEAAGGRGPRRVCRNCGKPEDEDEGVKLKNCARCLKVAYCSSACQKKDWKKHRMECEEAEEHNMREREAAAAAAAAQRLGLAS